MVKGRPFLREEKFSSGPEVLLFLICLAEGVIFLKLNPPDKRRLEERLTAEVELRWRSEDMREMKSREWITYGFSMINYTRMP